MNISQKNLERIKKTFFKNPDSAENGIWGSSFFALLRCIRMFGEPIDCEKDSKLYGLKALSVGNGDYIAIDRTVYKGGVSKCIFYWLEGK